MLHVSKKAECHTELVSASDSAFFVSWAAVQKRNIIFLFHIPKLFCTFARILF